MLPSLVLIAVGVYWALKEDPRRARRRRTAALPTNRDDGEPQLQPADESSFLRQAEDQTQALLCKIVPHPRFNGQAALLSPEEEPAAPLSAVDRRQSRQILAGTLGLGFMALGRWLFAPLTLLATPLFAYLSVPVYQQALADLRGKKKVELSGFLAVFTTGSWLIDAKGIALFSLLCLTVAEKISALTQDRTRKTLRALFARHQGKVFLFRDGVEVEVPLEQVQAGDELVLRAGQLIPVDGVVTHGMATVDQHQLTGESRLIEKGVSDPILSATFIQRGQLRVRVEKAGSDTLAAQTSALLERTTTLHLDRPERGLRLANSTVAPSLLIVGAALPFYGLRSSMALLSAMPGLDMYYAGPIALLSFLEMAAERQILIKDGRSLELLRTIDTVIFDKTGTLTQEEPELAQLHCFSDIEEDELLRLAAAAEHRQTHPVANAILAAAKHRNLTYEDVLESRYEVGFGIAARAGKRLIRVGSARFMTAEKLRLPARTQAISAAAHHKGHSLIYVAVGKRVVGALELRPVLRPDVEAVLADLRRRKLKLYILSGDQPEPTQWLAESLGIEDYFAAVLPEGKAAIVQQLQREGRKVCFVGDGVNDAIALKQADVSIAMQGATLLATDTAQIVLMNQSLLGLPQVLDLAGALERNVHTSFGISLGVAASLLSSVFLLKGDIGFLLVTGSLSLVVVVANALSARWTYKDKQLGSRTALANRQS